jgi:hypothetical protein
MKMNSKKILEILKHTLLMPAFVLLVSRVHAQDVQPLQNAFKQ